MTGSIYLIGGGEIKDGETRLIDEDLKSLAKDGSTFVFFGFAAKDNIEYFNTIKSVFEDKFNVLFPTKEKGLDYAVSAIESASIIYIGGGDTNRLIRSFSDWNLVEHLSAALRRGVHVAGMSAGAEALSSWYINKEDDALEIRKGWGIASACVLVHATQDSVNKAKSTWDNFDKDGSCPFIAISERAALRIDSEGEQKIGDGNIWRMNHE